MKMLLIVFRQTMVEHIHALLKEYDVTAVAEPLAYRLIDGFTSLKAEQGARQQDSVLSLHVFVLPCEQVV